MLKTVLRHFIAVEQAAVRASYRFLPPWLQQGPGSDGHPLDFGRANVPALVLTEVKPPPEDRVAPEDQGGPAAARNAAPVPPPGSAERAPSDAGPSDPRF